MMGFKVFKAHFDGEKILPDEPVDLPKNKTLVISVSTLDELNKEKESWAKFSMGKLSIAYATDEPEYDEELIKEPNKEYKP